MPFLWICRNTAHESSDDRRAWARVRLDAETPLGGCARLMRATTAEGERWVLVGPPSVRINGRTLDVGVAVLRDCDEVTAGGERVFFSTETLAEIVALPGERAVRCARDSVAIEPGTPAVACPACKRWYHQTESQPCWLYSILCSQCPQPTAFDTGFRFAPEDL